MFEKKRRALKRPTAPLMFYSNTDLFYNSYLTEALDSHSIRCLHFILKTTNNAKGTFQVSYEQLREGAELSCNNYVQKALKKLVEVNLIETSVVKRALMIKVLQTAKRLNQKKIA